MAASDIISRSGKGSSLSATEHDKNLNTFHGTVETQTGATYTVLYTDQGKLIELNNASMVCTLDAISTITAAIDTSAFKVTLKNINAADATVNPTGADTIDGAAGIVLKPSETVELFTDSTGAIWNIKSRGGNTITVDVIGDVTGNVTGNVTGDVAGNLTGNVTGDLTGDSAGTHTGAVTGNCTGTSHIISNAAGTTRSLLYQTAGVNRWQVNCASDAESGSNAGSSFQILRRADDGSAIDIPIQISRETGVTTISDLANDSTRSSYASSAAYAIGTYMLLASTATLVVGTDYAGSNFGIATIRMNVNSTVSGDANVTLGTAPTGTWKALNVSSSASGFPHLVLALRVS